MTNRCRRSDSPPQPGRTRSGYRPEAYGAGCWSTASGSMACPGSETGWMLTFMSWRTWGDEQSSTGG